MNLILDPRAWRACKKYSLADMAKAAGIQGKNPLRTYSRYESGQHPCPSQVIENIRKFSNGEIGAEAWQKARMDYLHGLESGSHSEAVA